MKKLKFKFEFFESIHHPEVDEKFHELNIGNIGRVLHWLKFFEMTRNIPGDIVECGIGRGRSLLVITAINCFLSKRKGGQRHIFGYDSFEGFPEPTIEDKSPRNLKKGEWSHSPSGKYKYSKKFIKLVLKEGAGIPLNKISLTLTKGFFSDSLKNHPQKPIAILHIDTSLYQSYKAVLENLFDKVNKGGVIVFNDFTKEEKRKEYSPGTRLAVKEFLGNRYKNLKSSSIKGTCFFIKK